MNRFFWTLSLCLGLGAAYSQTIYQFPLTNDLAAFEDRTIVLGTLSNESGETGIFGQVSIPPTTCSAADSARAYFFEDNAGLRFLNNRYIGCEYSISFTFKMDELSVRPGRTTDRVQLIEFGHNGQDRGIYLSVDEDTQGQATLSFWQLDGSGTGGSSIRVGAPLFFNTNDLYHLTLVRNCLDEVRIFINGERFGDPYADYNGVYYPSSASDTIYFFRDMPDLGLTEEASSGWIRNMVLADYEWTDQELSLIHI